MGESCVKLIEYMDLGVVLWALRKHGRVLKNKAMLGQN